MDDVLARALGYPYERPAGSFLFDARARTTRPLPDGVDLAHRHAVLAIGSNAAPAQLVRKFCDRPSPGGVIPVLPATLHDRDVVHAATLASYGSVPATVTDCPGCSVHVHVTLLDDAQLGHMDDSEGVPASYARIDLPAGAVTAAAPMPTPVSSYESTAGPLVVDGSPIALAAISATGRTFRAMAQADVLALVATREQTTLEELVAGVVGDATYRRAVAARLPR